MNQLPEQKNAILMYTKSNSILYKLQIGSIAKSKQVIDNNILTKITM